MISTKLSNPILKSQNIALSTLGAIALTVFTGSLSIVSTANAQYGLGLPRSAGTGGATRGNLPQITMLVPEDGAKTLAARPTFYWYIAPTTTAATAIPPSVDGKNSFKITFFLRDGNGRSAKSVFIAEGVADKAGLYKFTLPENAPALSTGKVQRWQIRWQTNGGASQVDVNAPIRRDEDPAISKLIATAKNDLEKARIYTKSAYWYDAIDAYTSWLAQNPQDQAAKSERSNLLKEGFKNHTAFSKSQEANITKLLSKLDESQSATSIVLQTKSRL
ncbi:DUF928 domain-containing protein [Pseudanabaena biceps]|nr:DUF928 domain-containing protein [Pseudanabaena biceps]